MAKASIWNQWSMTVKVEAPPSSAICAVWPSVEGSDAGAPGRLCLTFARASGTRPAQKKRNMAALAQLVRAQDCDS